MGQHGSSGKSHRHGHGSKEHRKHRHAPVAQPVPGGYGQWPPPDYYDNGRSSRRRRGGFGRKLLKLFLFLVLIGGAVGGGWYGMQVLTGNPGKESPAKKKKKVTTEEVAEETKKEEAKVEPKTEPPPKKEETKKEETKIDDPPPKKEEPKTKKIEPKTDPKDMPKVDGPLVYFDKHIYPLMVKHCIRCHGEGNKKFEGKFDARTVAGILKGSENGKMVVPGNPEKSLLWTDNVKPGQMPTKADGGKVSEEEKKLIYDWIKGGCKETAAVAAN